MQEILNKVNDYLQNSSACYIEVENYSKDKLNELSSLLEEHNYKHTTLDYDKVIKVERTV